jgi:3-hydroxyisobutyrate dehydrogenase
MAAARIGFIGLGRMGVPMVGNLLRAGFGVEGFDAKSQAGRELDALPGFARAESAQACVASANVVVLMLPDSKVVDRLLWEPPGLAAAMQSGTLVIDMGSSDPMHSRSNAERLGARGLDFIDAPVSGGVKRAIDGTLSIMAGGPKQTVERASRILQAMGKTLIHVGGAGAGHAVKALNNYVSAAGLIAVSEALVAAEKFGIDPHLVNQVFNASTGRNNTTERKVEEFMLSKRYDSGFALALMRKDVETAAQFIDGMGTPGRFARECLGVATAVEEALGAGADHTAVHAYIAGQVSA